MFPIFDLELQKYHSIEYQNKFPHQLAMEKFWNVKAYSVTD